MKSSILFFMIFITSLPSYSQDQITEEKNVLTEQVSVEKSDSGKNFIQRWWGAAKDKVSTIEREGDNDLYLTGYAYHDRMTYTKEKLKDLNEGAFGMGLGKTKINENGNTEMLYVMSHLDSHSDMQIEAGYAWLKNFHPFGDLKLGLGFASGLVSRSDMAGRIPIPFALPMAAIDLGKFAVNAILIPKLNDGINNGNVLFLFAKFTWGKNKNLLDF